MSLLLKSIKILDPSSPFNNQIVDIEVVDGQITAIEKEISLKKDYKEVKGEELCISKGWVDIHAQSGEPFNTSAESLDSLLESAEKGGFTHVAHFPTSDSPAESKSDIYFISNYSSTSPTTILPIGSIYKAQNPSQLTEMLEMKQAGAVGFTNGNNSSIKPNILVNALNYAKAFNGKILLHSEKKDLSHNGQVNQGVHSVMTGYKGIPKEAEYLAVRESIELAKYCNHEVLLLNITTAESLEAIKEAKKRGQKIWAAVSSFHLLNDDSCILDYDTNYKVNPPLRSTSDMKKIRKAVQEGVIDILYSQHIPKVVEDKHLEFDLASFGVVNLQTSFLATLKALGKEQIDAIISSFSERPAQYFGIEMPSVDIHAIGSYTIFDLKQKTNYSESIHASKSKNTPFFNTTFDGSVLGIISKGTHRLFQ